MRTHLFTALFPLFLVTISTDAQTVEKNLWSQVGQDTSKPKQGRIVRTALKFAKRGADIATRTGILKGNVLKTVSVGSELLTEIDVNTTAPGPERLPRSADIEIIATNFNYKVFQRLIETLKSNKKIKLTGDNNYHADTSTISILCTGTSDEVVDFLTTNIQDKLKVLAVEKKKILLTGVKAN
jgi:hypothetical protein